jgi:hypothetical protein
MRNYGFARTVRKIDRGMPISRGIKGLWEFSRRDLKDAVFGVTASVLVGARANYFVGHSPFASYFDCGAVANAFSVNRKAKDGLLNAGDPWTAIAVVYNGAGGTGQTGAFWQVGQVTDTGDAYGLGMSGTALQLMGAAGDSPWESSTFTMPQTAWSFVGCANRAANDRTWFLNGQTAVTSGTITQGFDFSGGMMVGGNSANGVPGAGWNGRLAFLAYWNRAFKVGEFQTLWNHPLGPWMLIKNKVNRNTFGKTAAVQLPFMQILLNQSIKRSNYF